MEPYKLENETYEIRVKISRNEMAEIIKECIEENENIKYIEHITRCADCKYYTNSSGIKRCRHKLGLRIVLHENDYCSYAELKDGEENERDI